MPLSAVHGQRYCSSYRSNNWGKSLHKTRKQTRGFVSLPYPTFRTNYTRFKGSPVLNVLKLTFESAVHLFAKFGLFNFVRLLISIKRRNSSRVRHESTTVLIRVRVERVATFTWNWKIEKRRESPGYYFCNSRRAGVVRFKFQVGRCQRY